MIRQISLRNTSDRQKWNDFVDSHPNATPFHHSSWLHVIEESYAFPPFLFVQEKEGKVTGVMPLFKVSGFFGGKRFVSIPFSDYGGPLCMKEANSEGEMLEFMRKVVAIKSIELRSALTKNGIFTNRVAYARHQLKLSPRTIEEIHRALDKKTIQYSIRKASKKGVEIIEDNSETGMAEFYRLNSLTRKKHGIPCQPQKFFNKIYDKMVQAGAAYLLFAIYEGKRVASGLFFRQGPGTYYKYNASDPEYLSQATPNHLLMWTAVEKALKEGSTFFDLGRTSRSNKGLLRYKRLWGTEETDLAYNFFPRIEGATSMEGGSKLYELGTKLWRALPQRISDKAGPILFKYFA